MHRRITAESIEQAENESMVQYELAQRKSSEDEEAGGNHWKIFRERTVLLNIGLFVSIKAKYQACLHLYSVTYMYFKIVFI